MADTVAVTLKANDTYDVKISDICESVIISSLQLEQFIFVVDAQKHKVRIIIRQNCVRYDGGVFVFLSLRIHHFFVGSLRKERYTETKSVYCLNDYLINLNYAHNKCII